MYPLKVGEIRGLLEEVCFRDITAFGDYKKEFDPKEPEFLTYVAVR